MKRPIDINAEAKGEARSELATAVWGPVPEEPAVPGEMASTYPQLAEDAEPEELKNLTKLEILIYLGTDTQQEFALQGTKTLGWFGINDLGYAVVHGFVPADESFELVTRDATGIETAMDLRGLGADLSTIEMSDFRSTPEGAFAILDLSTAKVATANQDEVVRSYPSSSEFYAELDRLQPILDGGQEGSEPETPNNDELDSDGEG